MGNRRKRRSFTRDYKVAALERMAETDNIAALAEELGIERKLLYCWRSAFEVGGEAELRRAGRPSLSDRAAAAVAVSAGLAGPAVSEPSRRIAELERKIGEQGVALDFFRAALRHVRARCRRSGARAERASTP
ncbi:MAG: transposase [Acetobacteraceae bacterium]